jgi:hypothetical protein
VSRLREAAALLVEQGRALGTAELARAVASALGSMAQDAHETDRGEEFDRLLENVVATAGGYEKLAESSAAGAKVAQQLAAELMAELEHPGARLARRLVATARSARAGWRGSR